jgi:molybdopterin synthase catalytic subunit
MGRPIVVRAVKVAKSKSGAVFGEFALGGDRSGVNNEGGMSETTPAIHIRIQEGPIDVGAEYAAVHAPENGGRVVFTGCVRPEEGGRIIDRLDYEHYSPMAERELEKLARGAAERWGLNAVRIVHRVGPIPVAEESVAIVTASGHRAEAFEAGRFLIDELKVQVPIWKAPPEPAGECS